MKTKPATSLVLATVVLLFFSCKKGQNGPDDYNVQSSIDNSFASSEFSAISNMVETEARNTPVVYKTSGNLQVNGVYCPGAIVTGTALGANQYRLEIDFGPAGSNCMDGRLRTGKLICSISGRWSVNGSVVTIVPEDYTVNAWAVQFNKTISHRGIDTLTGFRKFDVTISNGVISTPQGIIEYESNRTVEWIAGENTPANYTDDQYRINGSASGVARDLIPFTATIDQPLIANMNCQHLVQGVVSLTPQFYSTRTIDYGQGVCDDQAVLSIDGFSFNITLP